MSARAPKMPDLPDDLFIKIVSLSAEDRWWSLGSILRAGRRGKNAVYSKEVLKTAAIYCLCTDPSQINTFNAPDGGLQIEGRYMPFFIKCFDADNPIAIYYEGLRVVAEDRDIQRGIDILSRIVLADADATLACGILSICQGNEVMAIHYLQLFDAHHYPLMSSGAMVTGNDFLFELSRYKTVRKNLYAASHRYPDSPLLPSPTCAVMCCLDYGFHSLRYGDYEIMCKNCYLLWLSLKVSEIL